MHGVVSADRAADRRWAAGQLASFGLVSLADLGTRPNPAEQPILIYGE